MDDKTRAHHGVPVRVRSRFSAQPLPTLAIWSLAGLGWGALGSVALVPALACWTRRFRTAGRYHKLVGTRHAGRTPVSGSPAPDDTSPSCDPGQTLTGLPAVGLLPRIPWLWVFDPGICVARLIIVIEAKTSFVDGMVWPHRDLRAMTSQ
ncbi:MAG: DUF6653 family protein [Pseudomonadota bacterium]